MVISVAAAYAEVILVNAILVLREPRLLGAVLVFSVPWAGFETDAMMVINATFVLSLELDQAHLDVSSARLVPLAI